ncbi:MAG: excinuclease ATPase subunit [Burkholderiales bacterium]|nr:excinuclease ATPase subunit [Burkholderiales bacterium]
MEMLVKATVFTALLVSLSLFVTSVQARDTRYLFSIEKAIEMGKAQGRLDNNIKFYFGGQSHPAVATTLAKDVTTNKKTSRADKSNEEICNWVMLSALVQLQERARKEGGNAVINIESYFKKRSFSSKEQFECYVGSVMAGVALKGDVVKLKN